MNTRKICNEFLPCAEGLVLYGYKFPRAFDQTGHLEDMLRSAGNVLNHVAAEFSQTLIAERVLSHCKKIRQ